MQINEVRLTGVKLAAEASIVDVAGFIRNLMWGSLSGIES